ncbi:hypothetical protein K6119_06275 [Paracrocinitomix mangrovi]|uniref:toxin-antitoxin system YwqK family antitoxin n=1 Tax=Paracrocinitomix mangrovi TaxID=2862509 RepID=UPI001C8D5CF6|nr:hypothetical protein [Paracrocinitomix mangrovi]UKN03118.1 hypothetical protein K6119_06275 [Paracrocinitomix mangrovi]
MQYSLLVLLLISVNTVFSQTDTLNQVDQDGLKQGYWILYGYMFDKRDYPDSLLIEEGTYKDDRKSGKWIKYHPDGKTPRLIGEYVNGRPYGKYQKFYPTGQLMADACFERGRHKNCTHSFYYECGTPMVQHYFNENGREEGDIFYYFDSCDSTDTIPKVELSIFKIDGVSKGQSIKYYYSGCIKKIVNYTDDGEVISVSYYKDDCELPETKKGSVFTPQPDVRRQTTNSDYKTKTHLSTEILIQDGVCDYSYELSSAKNGSQKLYDSKGRLIIDGYVEDGDLIDGKMFCYTDTGRKRVFKYKKGIYKSDKWLNE